MWITPIIRPQYPFQLAFLPYKWIEWVYGKCAYDFKTRPREYFVRQTQKNTASCRGERQANQEVAVAEAAFRNFSSFYDSAAGEAADAVADVRETTAAPAAKPVACPRIAAFAPSFKCA
ncbi:hypothetical protein OZX72_07615 [Bifidobacterium sp. ESL0769]|uniref:hypothetical protein n=1 Tax=Bifidobacterium sp. ESL0769 TaxID=2983229 RepID=UPI0023F8D3B2|nr:hypothetical protein [Bifidobacterium sp. ESL0769]WEV67101.1 hypothetical protein OZX72_07615 [Bifidobacterium sp. ESL0769]